MYLSRMLSDLYEAEEEPSDAPAGPEEPEEAEQETAPTSLLPSEAPEWSDEHRLDEFFATWAPGPPADASAAERELVGAAASDGGPPADAGAETRAEARPWTRSDDDVLPGRGTRSGLRFGLLHR